MTAMAALLPRGPSELFSVAPRWESEGQWGRLLGPKQAKRPIFTGEEGGLVVRAWSSTGQTACLTQSEEQVGKE